jgi:hypothetical protein
VYSNFSTFVFKVSEQKLLSSAPRSSQAVLTLERMWHWHKEGITAAIQFVGQISKYFAHSMIVNFLNKTETSFNYADSK